jgi:transposase
VVEVVPPECAELLGVVHEQAEEIAALKAKVIELERGHQSERLEGEEDGEPAQEEPGSGRRGQRPGRPGHGRRRYEHLPVDEVVVEPDASLLSCEHCGRPFEAFGEESSEQIDWEVVVRRVRHRRPRYRRTCRCPGRATVQAPPPAKVIPKGLFTVGFIVHLVILRFEVGVPVQRVIALLAMEGLELSAGTLAGVLRAVGELLKPLAAAIREHNRRSAYLHADETGWPVFVPVEGKEGHRWWLWVFVGPDSVCYLIKPRRASWVVAEHLGIDLESPRPALPHGEGLVLHSDRYSVYDSIGLKVPEVTNVWCWAHVRRDFVRVREGYRDWRPWAEAWLRRIAALYRARGRWEAADHDSREAAEHGRQVAALVEEMRGALDRELADPKLHPAARKVLESLGYYWEGLVLPFEEPNLAPDNNLSERSLRGPVVSRKSSLGSGSEWSAELAADAWTVLGTADMAGWEPQRYLHGYLEACAQAGGRPPADLTPWLPWTASPEDSSRWKRPPPNTS